MRHTAEWWTERVAELKASSDVRAVAQRHGVSERTLKWWRSELRRRARDKRSPRLLPVVVKPTRPPVAAAALDELEVVVEVGAARMTLRGAVSGDHLAAIVTASARTC